MLQCRPLWSVACFHWQSEGKFEKWIYLQCRSKTLSALQSWGVMVSVTNGASGMKVGSIFSGHLWFPHQACFYSWMKWASFGSSLEPVSYWWWECLCQSFGKGFLNKVQVCPVAGQEPALANRGWPCRQTFWGCVLMAGIPNCQKCGAWDLCIGLCSGVPQLYGSLGQEALLWEAAGTWLPCLIPKCNGENLFGFFFIHE